MFGWLYFFFDCSLHPLVTENLINITLNFYCFQQVFNSFIRLRLSFDNNRNGCYSKCILTLFGSLRHWSNECRRNEYITVKAFIIVALGHIFLFVLWMLIWVVLK